MSKDSLFLHLSDDPAVQARLDQVMTDIWSIANTEQRHIVTVDRIQQLLTSAHEPNVNYGELLNHLCLVCQSPDQFEPKTSSTH